MTVEQITHKEVSEEQEMRQETQKQIKSLKDNIEKNNVNILISRLNEIKNSESAYYWEEWSYYNQNNFSNYANEITKKDSYMKIKRNDNVTIEQLEYFISKLKSEETSKEHIELILNFFDNVVFEIWNGKDVYTPQELLEQKKEEEIWFKANFALWDSNISTNFEKLYNLYKSSDKDKREIRGMLWDILNYFSKNKDKILLKDLDNPTKVRNFEKILRIAWLYDQNTKAFFEWEKDIIWRIWIQKTAITKDKSFKTEDILRAIDSKINEYDKLKTENQKLTKENTFKLDEKTTKHLEITDKFFQFMQSDEIKPYIKTTLKWTQYLTFEDLEQIYPEFNEIKNLIKYKGSNGWFRIDTLEESVSDYLIDMGSNKPEKWQKNIYINLLKELVKSWNDKIEIPAWKWSYYLQVLKNLSSNDIEINWAIQNTDYINSISINKTDWIITWKDLFWEEIKIWQIIGDENQIITANTEQKPLWILDWIEIQEKANKSQIWDIIAEAFARNLGIEINSTTNEIYKKNYQGKTVETIKLDEENEGNKEKNEIYKNYHVLVEVVDIWVKQAERRGYQTKNYSAFAKINEINDKMTSIWNTVFEIMQNENIEAKNFAEYLDKEIVEIFKEMNFVEKKIWVIHKDDMEIVKETLLDSTLTKDKKLLAIYYQMRDFAWSFSYGNSIDVKYHLEDKLLQDESIWKAEDWKIDKNYLEMKKALNEEEIWNFVELLEKSEMWYLWNNEKFTKLQKKLDTWFWKQFVEWYKQQMKSKEEEWKRKINDTLPEINEQRRNNWEREVSVDELLSQQKKLITYNLIKWRMLRNVIAKMPDRWDSKESFTWMYANLTGLSTRDSTFPDAIQIWDENFDAVAEASLNTVLVIASIWTWWLTMAWSIALMRSGAIKMWAKTITTEAWKKFLKNKALEIAIRAGPWGIAFHQWATLTQDIIYQRSFEEALAEHFNLEANLQSIAFMWWLEAFWAFKMWISKFLQKTTKIKIWSEEIKLTNDTLSKINKWEFKTISWIEITMKDVISKLETNWENIKLLKILKWEKVPMTTIDWMKGIWEVWIEAGWLWVIWQWVNLVFEWWVNTEEISVKEFWYLFMLVTVLRWQHATIEYWKWIFEIKKWK